MDVLRKFSLYFLLCLVLFSFLNPVKIEAKNKTLIECARQQAAEKSIQVSELKKLTCQEVSSLEGLEEFAAIESLEITHSQLQTLPESIKQLSRLKVLTLSNNQFTSLPTVIYGLSQLEELYVGNNQLQYIGKEIGQLKQLRVLYLGGNVLIYLPEEIKSLSNLETLIVSTNRLITLPDISTNKSLTTLQVNNNQLKTIPNFSNKQMKYIAADSNFLDEKTIKSKDKQFAILETNRLLPLYRNMKLTVHTSWEDMEASLARSVIVSNGSMPYGYTTYELVKLFDEQGKSVDLVTYLDNQTYQVKQSGTVTASIMVSTEPNTVKLVTAEQVEIEFRAATLPSIVPPVLPPYPDEQVPSPLVEDLGNVIIQGEVRDDLLLQAPQPTSQESTPTIVRPLSPASSETEDLFMPVWGTFFSNFADADVSSWLTFENVRFILLNMLFGFILFVPLIAFIGVMKHTRSLEKDIEEILYTENKTKS